MMKGFSAALALALTVVSGTALAQGDDSTVNANVVFQSDQFVTKAELNQQLDQLRQQMTQQMQISVNQAMSQQSSGFPDGQYCLIVSGQNRGPGGQVCPSNWTYGYFCTDTAFGPRTDINIANAPCRGEPGVRICCAP
jgi:hypothetical protein